MRVKKICVLLLSAIIGICCCSCSSGSESTPVSNAGDDNGAEVTNSSEDIEVGKPDSSLFEWDGNKITALTEKGKKKSSLVIPENCEQMGDMIFLDAEVKKITFEDDDDVKFGLTFNSSPSLEEIVLPENLSGIPMACFQSCASLKSITIPASVKSLDKYAFDACHSLEEVVFNGTSISEIPMACFSHCDKLQNIAIPEGVETISDDAFLYCSAINELTLPNTIKAIGDTAFLDTKLKELHLPEGVEFTSLNPTAFGINTSLMTVYVVSDSWCDKNRDSWDIGFGSIVAE